MMTQRTLKGHKKNLDFKRKLRREMTTAENKLWLKLRSKQLEGLKFRRQHGVGPFIVDFFCPENRLAIEVDGDVHVKDKQVEKDQTRGVYLAKLGIQVIRYNNDDVLNNIDAVMEDLYRRVSLNLPPPTPPYKGGEK